MITLTTNAIVKNKTPSQVYHWWTNLNNAKYVDWHEEHLKWEWKPSNENNVIEVGYKVFIREKIKNIDFKFWGKLVSVRKDNYLSFKHSFLPLAFSLTFDDIDNGTRVTWKMDAGFSGTLGKILDFFLSNIYFSEPKKQLIYKHIAEEHQLLETLIK